MISIETAQKLIQAQASLLSLTTKKVKLRELSGYVLAQDIYADRDYPPFHRALMDGFALKAKGYAHFHKKGFLLSQSISAGDSKQSFLALGECARIMTGAPLPPGADTVIPKEEEREESKKENGERSSLRGVEYKDRIYFKCKRVQEGQNVALQGEDMKAGILVLHKGKRLGNTDISSLASLGISQALVFSPPTTSILSTGNEIVSMKKKAERQEIRDANAPFLRAYLSKYHVPIQFTGIVRDDPKEIKVALRRLMKSDFIILSGGLSMGEMDFVPQVMEEMGVDCLFHRVNVKPAKPFWFGKKKGGPVFFGLPGNNFSVQVAFKIFIEPFLRAFLQTSPLKAIKLKLANGRVRKDKRPEYFPCSLNSEGLLEARNLRSSGDVCGALGSSGIALHPSTKAALSQASPVHFFFWETLD